ncbi:MAG: hypothetical protein Q9173_001893 [Seirophora scorigena]
MSVGLATKISNDWENFAYPIFPTKQVLRGRIFTSRPIRPRALFFMIDGGIATTRHQISELGDARLRARDNPYAYMVPGCHFRMWSKTAKGSGAPVMTYRMMREVFLALQEVLQKDEREFEASFVLTDQDRIDDQGAPAMPKFRKWFRTIYAQDNKNSSDVVQHSMPPGLPPPSPAYLADHEKWFLGPADALVRSRLGSKKLRECQLALNASLFEALMRRAEELEGAGGGALRSEKGGMWQRFWRPVLGGER